jgi:hypothetical protein
MIPVLLESPLPKFTLPPKRFFFCEHLIMS